ncbi:MAG: STAS domain-containing protein, partial [Lachnospiraceae bacterium]|nr:STAS domain-containing protein [Lachnospiraceae bacterium]
EKNGTSLTIYVEGRLDTTTAPELERELKTALDDVKDLTFNFGQLEYISSAGLRVIMSAQKIMSKQGTMVITNASDEVKEIFEVTGFSSIITIK